MIFPMAAFILSAADYCRKTLIRCLISYMLWAGPPPRWRAPPSTSVYCQCLHASVLHTTFTPRQFIFSFKAPSQPARFITVSRYFHYWHFSTISVLLLSRILPLPSRAIIITNYTSATVAARRAGPGQWSYYRATIMPAQLA